MSSQRKTTRTPPGFKDEGDGDFFVWADFLLGLLSAANVPDAAIVQHVIFVTEDKKADWSLDGTAHPILTAEVKALTNASFEIWSLDKLATTISTEL